MKQIISILLIYMALTNYAYRLLAQPQSNAFSEDTTWYNLNLIGLSGDNVWLHFNTHNPFGKSVTLIKNMETGESFDFINTNRGSFSSDSNWFSILSHQGSLSWLNLNSSKLDSLSNIKSSRFTNSSNFLIAQTTDNLLKFINLNSTQIISPGISSVYNMHPAKDWGTVALSAGNGEVLRIYDLQNNSYHDVLDLSHVKFKKINWNKNGEVLVFIYQTENKLFNLGIYDTTTKTTQLLNIDVISTKHNDLEIADANITINDEGNRVFFYAKNKEQTQNSNPSVEIWDTKDPVLLSRKKLNYDDKVKPMLCVWYTDSGKIIPLETKEFSKAVVNPNANFVLNFNPFDYEPQFHFNSFVDLYVKDLNNSQKDLIVKKQYTGLGFLSFSPDGNSISYFRDGNWWVYDFQKKTYSNLTIGLPVNFNNEYSTSFHTPSPFGLKGWSKDGHNLYIYDEYDIWKISVDGKFREKLTDGRKNKTVFRLVTGSKDNKTNYVYSAFNTYILNNENGLLLSATNENNLNSGFYRLNSSNQLEKIVFKNKRVTNLYELDDNSFIYQEESFNSPPAIIKKNLHISTSQTIFQSNKNRDKLKWPERKLIYYNTEFADSIKGVLIYPVNFNPNKKYPMIVQVYEKQSSLYNRFVPPNSFNEVGFNFMDYALNDYFVLLPDIIYQWNKIGISATQCVDSAVDKTLQTAPIDAGKIGLIGHSLGGYETAFILTQSNRFAAAVAGSGIFNLVSFYFGLYNITGHSEIFRVEQAIWRMKDSFFDNPSIYLENSPIHHFSNVSTPLMIWTGKQDANVSPTQSMEGYIALRRLRKKGVMYLYENEDHVIMNKENQEDLSRRIKHWFDDHLK